LPERINTILLIWLALILIWQLLLEEVKAFGKTIQYVGTPKGQSFGLSSVADGVRLLRPEEIEQFLFQSLI